MNKIIFGVLVSSTLACGGANNEPASPINTTGTSMNATTPGAMDGKTYDVMLTIPGEKPASDTLKFAGGKFESSACTPLGFPQWTAYTAGSDPSEFQVTTQHTDGTTMGWKGKIKGDTIEGTAVRTMKGTPATGTFTGTLKK